VQFNLIKAARRIRD